MTKIMTRNELANKVTQLPRETFWFGNVYDDFAAAGLATNELSYLSDSAEAATDKLINADNVVIKATQQYYYTLFVTEANRILQED